MELLQKTIRPAISFLGRLGPGDRVLIVHDDDVDGCSSGALMALILKRLLGRTFPTRAKHAEISAKIAKEARKLNLTHLIVLDIPKIPPEIRGILYGVKILQIDHHPPIKSEGMAYVNPRLYDASVYLPTSYLVYHIYKKMFGDRTPCWIAGIGVVGDIAAEHCADLIKEIKEVCHELVGEVGLGELYERSILGRLTQIINSARFVDKRRGARIATRALLLAGSYQQLLEGRTKEAAKLIGYHQTYQKEFKKVLEDFERNRIPFKEKRLLYHHVRSKLPLKSALATNISLKLKSQIILTTQDENSEISLSIRRGTECKIDLNDLVRRAALGIAGAKVGGHPQAAGGKMAKKYLEKFLNNLLALL
jgi:single-stranded DNA-specific DHH superfamily exonuclease